MKYGFIELEKAHFPISLLCEVLGVSRSGFYAWRSRPASPRHLTIAALTMAVANRGPAAQDVLHHSDRGSQYASEDHRQALAKNGFEASMSRKGNCWDNAVAESFFATLKTEMVHQRHFATRIEARTAVFEYIEVFNNRRRRHSSLGYLSPAEFEANVIQPVGVLA